MTRTEAKQEAIRLTKQVGREIDLRSVDCDCDFWPYCGRCNGSGTWYEFFYVSCSHTVQDGEDEECEINFCAEQEKVRKEMEAA